MSVNKKNIILPMAVFVMLLFLLALPFRHQLKTRFLFYYGAIKYRLGGHGPIACENCDVLFVDGIKAHEIAYQKEGIKTQENDKGLLKLKQKGVLKEIETNDDYIVRRLSHSQPILLPKAIRFLNSLSDLYQQKCLENQLSYFPFEITSGTRSIASVKRLSEDNENAIPNSPHLHGKTFDVSYGSFFGNKPQRKQFIAALSELRKQNKCFVKYERNGCLHITVR